MKKLKKLAAGATAGIGSALMTTKMVFAQATGDIGDVEVGTGFALNIGTLISSLLRVTMILASLLVFGYLIWGGIEWITSGGDKSKTESARNKITAAVIGLVILAASYAILQLLLSFLGFQGGLDSVLDSVGTINDSDG